MRLIYDTPYKCLQYTEELLGCGLKKKEKRIKKKEKEGKAKKACLQN